MLRQSVDRHGGPQVVGDIQREPLANIAPLDLAAWVPGACAPVGLVARRGQSGGNHFPAAALADPVIGEAIANRLLPCLGDDDAGADGRIAKQPRLHVFGSKPGSRRRPAELGENARPSEASAAGIGDPEIFGEDRAHRDWIVLLVSVKPCTFGSGQLLKV